MRPDGDVKHDVLSELRWEPRVNEAHIGVTVRDGAVALTRHVPSYPDKLAAERAVRRVYGVLALADQIEVRLPTDNKIDDEEVAHRIAHVLEWSSGVPSGDIKAEVSNGFVTLTGEVEQHYQRYNAERQVQGVVGVISVINLIAVRKHASVVDVKREIEEALRRNAEIEASKVDVSVSDGVVTLTGEVDSFHDMDVIEDAAWSTPGVVNVRDNLRFA